MAMALVILNGLLILLVVNGLILRKQQVVDTGRTVFLELAPVDPRSLMQGDYMILGYALARDESFRSDGETVPTRGRVVLKLDEEGRGTFARFENADEEPSLSDDEIYLGYRKWRRGWRFGIESFFFEEGQADTYDQARFAEVRVSDDGLPVLVDLRAEGLRTLPLQDELPEESE